MIVCIELTKRLTLLSTVLYCVHAIKETLKNSHLSTQEGSNFSAQESFSSLGNFVSLKKGGVKSA